MIRTTLDRDEEIIYIGRDDFAGFLLSIIKGYRFRFDGKSPQAVVVPDVMEVDGVEIRYEAKHG